MVKGSWAGWAVFCISLACAVPVLQASGIKMKPRVTATPAHQEIVISAVSPTVVTVTEQIVSDKGKVLNKTSKAYLVSQFTEITVNGQRATIADLKPGMKATVTIGTDPTKAARIVANG